MKQALNFFVGKGFIVTFHLTPVKGVTHVWEQLVTHESPSDWDAFYIFYKVLDQVVDSYFPIVSWIGDELDHIEDNIKKDAMDKLMTELFRIRKMLLTIGHTIHPMSDLLYRMVNSNQLDEMKERREYFSHIHQHLLKLSEMMMSSREVTADIRDSYLSLNAYQTNKVVKILTIIASIFAPLTFISGIYGMNFENMPGLSWKYGYFSMLGFMGMIGVAMYLWFRNKGWFK